MDIFIISSFFLCLALGGIVGILAGLLGIGGGLVLVPVLAYFFVAAMEISFSLAMPMAVATSLASIILTSSASARAHYLHGNLQASSIPYLSVSVALGAVLGAFIVSWIPAVWLKNAFGVLVLLIAMKMFFAGEYVSRYRVNRKRLLCIGGVVGSLSAMLGIGGGALMVPALNWLQTPIKQAIASASFCGAIIAFCATLSFVYSGWNLTTLPQGALGYVYLPAAIGVVISSVFTARIGARMATQMPTVKLKKYFAIFLLCVGTNMLINVG